MKRLFPLLIGAMLTSACAMPELAENGFVQEAKVTDVTRAGELLVGLPLPTRQIPVVVYDFQDQTGQFKYSEQATEYSSAVTKGGLSVLVKALLDTGSGRWFTVAERGGLNNLLKERQIIRTMRSEYTRPDGSKLPDLPPMIYGGMLLEGGIVFYDSNILTGGAAAGYFGISGSAQYRRDIVTVYLRAVDINTGQVILAVNSSKTVFSYAVSGSVLRYLSFDKLLEAETGFSVNEPSQLAVRQAIETSLYSLVMEGTLRGMWGFADQNAGKQAITDYVARRDSGSKVNMFDGTPPQAPASVAKKAPAKEESSWFDSWFGSEPAAETIVQPKPRPKPAAVQKPFYRPEAK